MLKSLRTSKGDNWNKQDSYKLSPFSKWGLLLMKRICSQSPYGMEKDITMYIWWYLVISIEWEQFQPLKLQPRLQQTTIFATFFSIFEENKVRYFMRIVCQQTILMKYHALFVIFLKSGKIWNCRLLQIVGGALRVNTHMLNLHKGCYANELYAC